MLLRDETPAVKAQVKEWPNGPKPVGEPLFSAYRMDEVPNDCDVMAKLRAKFAQYEEEDQQTGYVRSFLHKPGQEGMLLAAEAQVAQPSAGRPVPLSGRKRTGKPKTAGYQASHRTAGGIVQTLRSFLGGCA